MKTKIVFLARDCDSTKIVYNFLKKHIEFEAVIFEKNFSKIKHFKNRIKRLGFWHAVGQAAFMILINPLLKLFSQKRKKEIIEKYQLDLNVVGSGSYKEVETLNCDESRSLLKRLEPDLIIINGTRIISKKTLESVTCPFINIHVGITPMFRGVHGGYWAMATGRKDLFGVTIHYVDSGVDTGGIIEQIFINPSPKDNFYTYPYLKYAEILPVLKDVIDSFKDGQKPPVKTPVSNESKLWYHPTLFQYLRNLRNTY